MIVTAGETDYATPRTGRLPDWEVPNLLTKYAAIMKAYELSR